jgi:hypothetical protein
MKFIKTFIYVHYYLSYQYIKLRDIKNYELGLRI